MLFDKMAVSWVLAILLAAAASSSTIPDRIVGGSPASVERYPSIVQVDFQSVWTNTWSQSCAGSILNDRYVISAAHCFEGWSYAPENRRIRAGATYRNTGGVINYVEKEFNHPSYTVASAFDGDISAILLQEPLEYSPVVQPGVIPAQGWDLGGGWPVLHAGWGAVTQGGAASPELLDVTIYTVDREVCQTRYNQLWNQPLISENMICAGLLDQGGADACQGDSGGPMYYLSNGEQYVIGIVSWGQGCAQANYPGVSTKVSSYTEWIVQTASSA